MELELEIFNESSGLRTVSFSPKGSLDVLFILKNVNRIIIEKPHNYILALQSIVSGFIEITGSEFGNIIVNDGENFQCLVLEEKSPGGRFNVRTPIKVPEGGMLNHSYDYSTSLISNNVEKDPRSKGNLPENHPKIKTFLSTSIFYNDIKIGQLALANKEGGYTVEDMEKVTCLNTEIGNLLNSWKTPTTPNVDRMAEIDNVKNKFLATVSHELRTPLNGITAMITLLPDAGKLNDKQREYVKLLTECTFQLTNLLNNILDFSRMAADCLTLCKQPFKISDSVADAISITEGKALAKQLKITVDMGKDIPTVIGDSQRITQVLSNLLSNSVKFTEKGGIVLTVRSEIVSINDKVKRKIVFNVRDTGIGIDKEEQGKIFETFHQSSSLNTYLSKSGTGLGLSISRELVKLMGGSLSVISEGKDKGSTFSFYIFVDDEIVSENVTEIQSEFLKGANVLVVDDRTEIRIQLYKILEKWGCKPFVYASAEEALLDLRTNMKYKVAIVDIHMPYMSGIELAKTCRTEFPGLKLIGISSITVDGGEDWFDHYMFKQVDENELFPALIDCLMKSEVVIVKKKKKKGSKVKIMRRLSDTTMSKRLKKKRSDLKILIAEDDPYNSYSLREMLKNLGMRDRNIVDVTDGKKCLEEIKINNYDVVLMDLLMPIMDGYEATKHIRQLKVRPFVIAISAAVQNSDKQKCQQVGIDCYLSKPLIKERLLEALNPILL